MPLSTVLGAQSLIKPGVCTTATRPASPYTGQAIYDTTVATTLVWSGSAWIGSAGKVLQVINATYSTQTSSSSSTFSDTGLTATITPSSISSKILVLVSQNGNQKNTNNTYQNLQLLRGATNISSFGRYGGATGSGAENGFGSVSAYILDSPATVSATTYKTQQQSNNNNAQVICQADSAISTITLMEISA